MDARAWNERYAAAQSVWSLTPNQFVATELGGLEPGRGIDLGAGEGRNALWLASLGWQMTAVDFSEVAVDRGRSRDTDSLVTWVVDDALTHPLGDRLDLAVVSYLQLPAESRRVVVRRALDALAPGGTFFLIAHDSTNLTEGTGGPQDARFLYTADDVLADLDGLSFTVERAERVPRVVTADDGHGGVIERVAWDALVRATRS